MGGVTASGYPYVTPTDHPKEFPAHSQALANKLEADGTWTAYVPTVTNAAVSAVTAEYCKVGRTVIVSIKATFTSVSGLITFSPPAAADAASTAAGIGVVRMVTGAGVYWGFANMAGGTSMTIHAIGANGINSNTSATVPAAWASGNSLAFVATYKSAA